jgi:hypothetical protein
MSSVMNTESSPVVDKIYELFGAKISDLCTVTFDDDVVSIAEVVGRSNGPVFKYDKYTDEFWIISGAVFYRHKNEEWTKIVQLRVGVFYYYETSMCPKPYFV